MPRRTTPDRPQAVIPPASAPLLAKAKTGITGLDELTSGGLPQGRPTLVAGSAGCGKTLLAMEFLVHGAVDMGEPGVFMAFEESPGELITNFASLGYDLPAMVAAKQLVLEFVHVERSEIEETGEYDLEALFIRLGYAIDSIGAKRVVLDTVEALFSGLTNTAILRAELRRMFRWLKNRGVTAVITGERGESSLTRYGLEEYVADCVIMLDHRVDGQMATRRLRIVKYRGSQHGTSEYPFLIDTHGISILPITSLGLTHEASTARISSGVAGLDAMMENKGFYVGASVLVSGTAGTGKSSLAAHFARATAARGERCLWFAFEESSQQITRNMRSIGIDLAPLVERGLLRIHADRPTVFGIEMHLVTIHRIVTEFRPTVVIVDPVSNFLALGSITEVKALLTRLIDYFKQHGITAMFTSLTTGGESLEATEVGVSSLMDTWLVMRDVESGAERNRVMHLLKSRGMAHSNQMREFRMGPDGIELRDVYTGPSGDLLLGSARLERDAQELREATAREHSVERQRQALERRRRAVDSRIASLREAFEVEQGDATASLAEEQAALAALAATRSSVRESRRDNGLATVTTSPARAGKRRHGK